MLSPVVDEVAEERTDVKVGKVNVDEQPELAGEFGVMSIPTLLVFEQGKLVRQAVGARPKAGVLDLLYLAFICGAGYVIWALLMKNNPVSRIAIFGFVNPVVNVLLSALLNGEPLFRWQYMGALVLVCVGIWLVNKAPKKEGV